MPDAVSIGDSTLREFSAILPRNASADQTKGTGLARSSASGCRLAGLPAEIAG
jgi:hypothetical protein